MGFTISYKPLFEIRLLHHYFLDSVSENEEYTVFDLADAELQQQLLANYDSRKFLHIQPTEACAILLRQYNCVFRQLADKIVVAIKSVWDAVSESYRPEMPLPSDLAFTFQINIVDPNFIHYTNILLEKSQGQQEYFFENRALTNRRTYPSLSQWAPQRSAGTWYHQGEILVDDAAAPSQTLIAEAILGSGSPTQNFTVDPAVNDAPVNYVNRNDWCLFAGKICTLDTGLIERSQNVAVTVWHPSGVQVYPKIAAFEDHTSKIQIRWEEWEEGLYQITLSDPVSSYTADHRVFVYKSGARPEGIIRIHAVADAPEYNLLTEDGSLRAGNQLRTFELRYKNRSTTWRYLGSQFSNIPESGPHPLTQHGFVAISVPNAEGDTVNLLPNPALPMVKAERTLAFTEFYKLVSEIYINS